MDNKNNSFKENIKDLDKEANKIGIGGKSSPEVNEFEYKKNMQKRKDIQKERLKIRNTQKGLVIVFTGNGKGKTTASLGMAIRTLGHGHKVVIIQFIKGAWKTGEEKAFKNLYKNISWHSLGEGFTWETQDRIRDEELVRRAWEVAKKYIQKNSYKLVILDEINIAIKLGYIQSDEIIKFLKTIKKNSNHIVLTGRGASKSIIEFADLVTEMVVVKHPFKEKDIKAQQCIEY